MKLSLFNLIPFAYNRQTFQRITTNIEKQVNSLSEGRISAKINARTSAPTTGVYKVGDFVANAAVSELGSGGSKYILTGWTCTVSDPLTFVETRCLTGN